MGFNMTQEDYYVAKQRLRNLRIRINLLNFNYLTVGALEGVATSGNISIDANSDIRRTCNISMVVEDSTFGIEPGGKIWMDKYIQVYVGIDNILTGEVNWQNMGIYLINNPSRTYNATTNTLSFQAVDLMAKMTGMRNGNLEGLPHIVPAGSEIRDVISQIVVELAGFTKYVIADNPQIIPFEIRVEVGGTVFDLLKKIRDISPNYEVFFDIDGVFHYQLIPSGRNDPILVDNDLFDRVITGVDTDTNFDEVKNVIEVLGRSHSPSVFVDVTSVAGGDTYVGTAVGITAAISPYIVIGFVPTELFSNPKLKINELPALPILNEDGSNAIIPIADGFYYCVQAVEDGSHYLYLGTQQIYATISETNPDSPFYIGNDVGKIRIVLSGGEYENIWTNDLALQRAEYELYLHARLMDNITLRMIPIYWLDVNIKIEYINEEVGLTNKKWNPVSASYDLPSHFLISKIDVGLGKDAIMNVTASRFYPLYTWL